MRSVVAALGNFDGVHLGHQAVLRTALEEGRRRRKPVVAATFDPHPRAVLRPGDAPRLLTTVEMRRELLLRYGADEVYVIHFDEALSRKTPEEFVRDVLVNEIEAGAVVVGENFRFGHRASGDLEDLRRLMREHGGEAFGVPLRVANGDDGIDSTRIRAMVSAGDLSGAGRLLGHPYVIRGEVASGDHRGRTIGFPTANVIPDSAVVVPGTGVYAGFAQVGEDRYAVCTNVGVAPTFERGEKKIEAHLLDFDEEIYGRIIDVSFTARIRDERRFAGIEELKEQIARDVEEARRLANDTA